MIFHMIYTIWLAWEAMFVSHMTHVIIWKTYGPYDMDSWLHNFSFFSDSVHNVVSEKA